jgi:TolB protein
MSHRPSSSTTLLAALALSAAGGLAGPARAQQGGDETVRFRVQAGGRDLLKVAVPRLLGADSRSEEAAEELTQDLSLSGFFRSIDSKSFLANLDAEGLTIVPQDWKNVGAEAVVKGRLTVEGGNVRIELKLYEVAKGSEPVLTREYKGPVALARHYVHLWAGEVVKYFTGEESFFASRIAFAAAAGPKRKDLYAMDWDGANVTQLTRASQNLLPSWSPSGADLFFTSYLGGKPDLWAVSATGGKPRAISSRPGLNIGPAVSPDGTKIAATLSQDGNSEIYLLSRDGAILKRLTNNPFIDTSPSWSPDGTQLAFVSDRLGSPQIFVMNADGSGQRRLTTRGTYNQTPAWSPRKDLPLVAFTARDEKYNYDIFTIHVQTGELVRITEGKGSNQKPTWAPNGRAIAYESTRGGLWISTYDGRTERQIYRGSASTPAWGPSLSK